MDVGYREVPAVERIMAQLLAEGVVFSLRGDQVHVAHITSRRQDNLIDMLKLHKDEVVALLSREAEF
jgi:hypothetical protein